MDMPFILVLGFVFKTNLNRVSCPIFKVMYLFLGIEVIVNVKVLPNFVVRINSILPTYQSKSFWERGTRKTDFKVKNFVEKCYG